MHTRVHAKQPLVPIHRDTRVHTQRTPRDRDPDTRTRKNTNQSSRLWPRTSSSTRGSGRSDSLRGLRALAARLPGAVCLSVSRSLRSVAALAGSEALRSCAEMPRSFALSFAPSHSAQPPPRPLRTPPLPLCPAPAAPWEETAANPAGQRPKGVRAASATHWPREPSYPGAAAYGPREGRLEGGCASRAHDACLPTWARRPPEPLLSSEARACSGTWRRRHHTEPSLLPGPSPVGLPLLHLVQNRRRHQARSAFRPVA